MFSFNKKDAFHNISEEDWKNIYERLDRVNTLDYDCGELCEGICCKKIPGLEMIMYLMPGEDKIHDKDDDWLIWTREKRSEHLLPSSWGKYIWYAECRDEGKCKRKLRPLQCRTFPACPFIDKGGEMYLILESVDLPYICPLIDERIELKEDFLRETYEVWKFLLENKKVYDYVLGNSKEYLRSGKEIVRIFPK